MSNTNSKTGGKPVLYTFFVSGSGVSMDSCVRTDTNFGNASDCSLRLEGLFGSEVGIMQMFL